MNETREASAEFEELTDEECLHLLRSCPVGRVAVSRADAAPLIVPVNFVLDGRAIVFRSASGTKIDQLREGPLGFEVDGIDPVHHTGWSVFVEGAAYEATTWEVGHLELEAWAPGEKDRWVRLVPHLISGRRISRRPMRFDAKGYL
jgi:nitroimidazol reductase NimA-like FMN-containing flavoprotein (pyridoxamine 5'-phosphate oxidase superfamily)